MKDDYEDFVFTLYDDFVTTWSKYLLTLNDNELMFKMTTLAEMGQVEAIEKWYLLKNPNERNTKIEAVADKIIGDKTRRYDINVALMRAARELAKNKKMYQSMKDSIKEYMGIMKKERSVLGFIGPKTLQLVSQIQTLRDKLSDSSYGRQMNYAVALVDYCKHFDNTDVNLDQKRLEIKMRDPYLFGKPTRKEVRKVRKTLTYSRVKNPYDPNIKYSLACNYLMNPSTLKQKDKAIEMLTELACRPITKQLSTAIDEKIKFNK